nr:serine/threonine-protein kinase [uncultured Actinoplanes sp.]
MTAIGDRIAYRYRIVRPLGSGGLSRVWLAVDERFDRPVALKACPPPSGLTPAEEELVRGWTLKEARAFARVRHPNVVRIRTVLDDSSTPWLVMEYIACRSLLQVIEQEGPVTPRRAAEIGLAVLAGLGAAGRAGVLHLDVKPGNVLIADDGRILLTDFGPVVTGAGMAALASAGIAFGSPKYLAPERLSHGVATERADLWSLGATLYHAVEGRPPYQRDSTEALLHALAEAEPDPPRRAGPIAPVIEGLLRRRPEERMSAAEATDRLRRVVRSPVRLRRAVAAGLVLVAASSLGAARVLSDDGQAPRSVPVTAVPAPATVLAAGFTWWADSAGFRIAVPPGWRVSRQDDGGLLMRGPGGRPVVRVERRQQPRGDVVAAMIAEEKQFQLLPGYHRIRILALPEPPDAVWEFTYRGPGGMPMRGLRRVAGDYLIDWRAPAGSWAAEQPTMATVLESFTEPRR